MKEDEDIPLVKAKALALTEWKGKPVSKGAEVELPQSVIDQNPTLFEAVKEKEKAKDDK